MPVVVASTICVGAGAQTAHFAGVQSLISTGGFSSATGIAVDANGSIYIADAGNNRVLKETYAGSSYSETVIASGLGAPSGIAVDASGNVYVAESSNNQVSKLAAGSYAPSIVVSGLSAPAGVAVDGTGAVYISDSGNNRVLKETLAGSSYSQSVVVSGLANPTGVAVDTTGTNVFITDSGNDRIVDETLSAGSYTQSVVASGLGGAWGVAVDAAGAVYFANAATAQAFKETPSNGSYAQSVVPSSNVSNPLGIAVDGNGAVYLLQSSASINTVVKETLPSAAANLGSATLNADSSTSTDATPATLFFAFDSAGTIATPSVLTQGASALDFEDAGSGTCTTNGSLHSYNAGDVCGVDVVFEPLYPGLRSGAVNLATSSGSVIATGYLQGTGVGPQINFMPAATRTFSTGVLAAYGMGAGSAGNFYVGETVAGPSTVVVKGFWSSNTFVTTATVGSGFVTPVAVAADGAGNVYIADQGAQKVYKETLAGGHYTQSVVDDTLGAVSAMAVDASGNVYIARGDSGVEIETLSGGSYSRSEILNSIKVVAIAVDFAGNILVSDGTTVGIRKETPSGSGYTESTMAATQNVTALTVDGLGNIYFYSDPFLEKETVFGSSYRLSFPFNNGVSNLQSLTADPAGNLYYTTYNASTSQGTLAKLDSANQPYPSFSGTTAVGSTSSAQAVITVANVGNATLTLPILSGNNPSVGPDFTIDTSSGFDCPIIAPSASTPGTLAAGASCTLAISFQPTVEGSIVEWLSITSDTLNAPAPNYTTQVMQLSGTATGATGLTPKINWLTPASIVYGTPLSATQLNATATDPNTSAAVPGTFYYSSAAGTILPAGATNNVIKATFVPTDKTTYTTATASVTLAVAKATPVLNFASSPASPVFGGLTAITVSFTDQNGQALKGIAPSGSASFSSANSPPHETIAGTVLIDDGVATWTTSALLGGNSTISVSYSGDANYNSIPSGTTSYTVKLAKATPVLALKSSASSVVYGNSVTLTATLTGPGSGPTGSVTFMAGGTSLGSGTISNNVATVTTSNLAAGTDTIKASYGGDANYNAAATVSISQTVSRATSAGSLLASANPVFTSNPVTFSVSLNSAATGTVVFYDGTSAIGTVTLSAGAASLTTGTLAAGTHSVTATYSGDTNFSGMTTAAVEEVVEDFALSTPSSGSTSATASSGSQAKFVLAVGPASGTTPSAISFSLTGLPSGASASFSPASLPAGSGLTNVTITVTLPAQTAAATPERIPTNGTPWPAALALLLLPAFGMRRSARKWLRISVFLLAAGLGAAALAGLSGCGGGSSSGKAASPQTYNLTFTATSGSLSHSTPLTLTVE